MKLLKWIGVSLMLPAFAYGAIWEEFPSKTELCTDLIVSVTRTSDFHRFEPVKAPFCISPGANSQWVKEGGVRFLKLDKNHDFFRVRTPNYEFNSSNAFQVEYRDVFTYLYAIIEIKSNLTYRFSQIFFGLKDQLPISLRTISMASIFPSVLSLTWELPEGKAGTVSNQLFVRGKSMGNGLDITGIGFDDAGQEFEINMVLSTKASLRPMLDNETNFQSDE